MSDGKPTFTIKKTKKPVVALASPTWPCACGYRNLGIKEKPFCARCGEPKPTQNIAFPEV